MIDQRAPCMRSSWRASVFRDWLPVLVVLLSILNPVPSTAAPPQPPFKVVVEAPGVAPVTFLDGNQDNQIDFDAAFDGFTANGTVKQELDLKSGVLTLTDLTITATRRDAQGVIRYVSDRLDPPLLFGFPAGYYTFYHLDGTYDNPSGTIGSIQTTLSTTIDGEIFLSPLDGPSISAQAGPYAFAVNSLGLTAPRLGGLANYFVTEFSFQLGSVGDTIHLPNSAVSVLDPSAPIPEPSQWAIMLVGLGLLGTRMVRRRPH